MMECRTGTLVSSLQDHFARAWAMWEEVIGNIPEEQWRQGDIDQLIPARHLIHVVVCADVFSEDTPFEQYDELKLFEVREWGTPAQALPSRQVALRKLADIRATVARRLARFGDAGLLEPERVHRWTGETRLAKMLYVLRHTQHHLGEISGELKRRGIRGYRRWD